MSHLVGLDPGRAKCGLVLVDPEQRLVIDGVVLPPSRVISQLKSWSKQEGLRLILLGNGTSSEQWNPCLLYTSPSPRDRVLSRMPSSA